MNVFIEAVGFGIAAGAVVALGAVGFTVQFGISNVLNITYGALMTLAAYLGYALLTVGVGRRPRTSGTGRAPPLSTACSDRSPRDRAQRQQPSPPPRHPRGRGGRL